MRYYVYIMAGHSRTLYTGVTRDLTARVCRHRHPIGSTAFSARYCTTRLVFFQVADNMAAAIAREKQIKGMRRDRKIALIESSNPAGRDLAKDWFQDGP